MTWNVRCFGMPRIAVSRALPTSWLPHVRGPAGEFWQSSRDRSPIGAVTPSGSLDAGLAHLVWDTITVDED